MPSAPILLRPSDASDWSRVRGLLDDYIASLGIDLGYQDIDAELARLPDEYGAPHGAFLCAAEGDTLLGCAGLRRHDAHSGEMKRMYVVPAARGRGVGRLLAEGILAAAHDLGYRRVVLDSWPAMTAARALYAALGFTEIAPYCFSPVPGTVFMERRLRPA